MTDVRHCPPCLKYSAARVGTSAWKRLLPLTRRGAPRCHQTFVADNFIDRVKKIVLILPAVILLIIKIEFHEKSSSTLFLLVICVCGVFQRNGAASHWRKSGCQLCQSELPGISRHSTRNEPFVPGGRNRRIARSADRPDLPEFWPTASRQRVQVRTGFHDLQNQRNRQPTLHPGALELGF